MKKNYINSLIFGIICLTLYIGQSQSILIDGYFSEPTAISHDAFEPPTAFSTSYFDNGALRYFSPVPLEKVVIAGSFQSSLNCENDWDPGCDYTQLTYNASTGLYTGTFRLPEGSNQYKVTIGGSWDINYGENGIFGGADIFLCLSTGSEEITFTYDPSTNLVTTSPVSSGFSPECLPLVILGGSFQDELGCYSDWVPDCTNTALNYNSGSGLFEGDFNIPTGCYQYRVVLENKWHNSYGQDGIYNGPNYIISIPSNPEITRFTYDPVSHIVTSTPYSGAPQEVTEVSLIGTLQDELGCTSDIEYECDYPALLFNPDSGAWTGSFSLPSGCYTFRVKETFGCIENVYGENGLPWGNEIFLFVPTDGEITFSYDPESHIINSTPYIDPKKEVTKVSLFGSLQDELGCVYDYNSECDAPALLFNSETGAWEGDFTLPAGCYSYYVKETSVCGIVTLYGENGYEQGSEIQLFIPSDGDVTFSYDPETHLMSSTPNGSPGEAIKVSIIGTLQDELGCAYDNDYECENTALVFNPDTGAWEGIFMLPAGCYVYLVKETSFCNFVSIYGENGIEWGAEIPLYVPTDGEITFSYNPQTHVMNSTPYFEPPQELTSVSLFGTLQSEFGCAYDYNWECNTPALQFNPDSGTWEGSFIIPAGCYTYYVKETIGCNIIALYGEEGIEWGNEFQLYVTSEGEVTFSYDPETHNMSATPNSEVPQEVTRVSIFGSLQDELGCSNDFDYYCDKPALQFNTESGLWEGSFTLMAGCYSYYVKETFGCNYITFYGENGIEYGDLIQLFMPIDGEFTLSYNPQTHIISSTPYGAPPQEVTEVSLYGSLQDELGCNFEFQYDCDKPALKLNSDSGLWEGIFTIPAGCYIFMVKETFGCNIVTFYGEFGIENSDQIQLYVPAESEITFSYNPQTHLLSSTPFSGAPQELRIISLVGSLQDELGCVNDYQYECDTPALLFNPNSGLWEGSFTLPAGCYTYWVKETIGCNFLSFYGENGVEWGEQISLFVPTNEEITFSYDPQTHTMKTTPYTDISTLNQCPENISVNNSPGECGAIVNYPVVATSNCGGEIHSVTQIDGLPSGSFFPVGITTNTFMLTKISGEELTCSFDIVVIDTEPPVISDLNQNYEPLWPPNHKMIPVFLEYLATDNCNIASTEISISSNEPQNGLGDGDQAPDWEILDEHNILLRAERSGKGNGREYYITIKVTDSSGNFSEQLVTVSVPRDNGKKTQEIMESGLSNNKYTLYPNGADDIINIKGPKSLTNISYVIYDMLGVMKKRGTMNNEQIEVVTLPTGIYIVKFETDEGYVFKKFIKN